MRALSKRLKSFCVAKPMQKLRWAPARTAPAPRKIPSTQMPREKRRPTAKPFSPTKIFERAAVRSTDRTGSSRKGFSKLILVSYLSKGRRPHELRVATKSRSFQRVRLTYEGTRCEAVRRECPFLYFHRPNPPFPFRPVPEIQTDPLPAIRWRRDGRGRSRAD